MAKIPWSRIQEAFSGEWVELVECAWKADSLHPRAGIVRHHSADRRDLLKKIRASGCVEGSVVMFVGNIPSLSNLSSRLYPHQAA
jgi:hypothetical protein